MKEIDNLKRAILEEYPRMDLDSEFSFKCHPGVTCFNQCCADVNIFLTPYDVIRLKNRLGITSGEFLAKYTLMPFDENSKFPVLLFKMQDNEKKSCHLVGDEGCTVYEDRPWACRMYPMGMASPKEGGENADKEFYFLLEEDICQGHNEDNKMTVADWIKDQGIDDYNKMGEYFKDITLHSYFEDDNNSLNAAQVDMFFTACYNVDKFRDFVFKSTFLQKFDVDEDTQAKIKTDDVEMMKFGFRWIRFAIFGEKTMEIKGDAIASTRRSLAESDEDVISIKKWRMAFDGLTEEQKKYSADNAGWTLAETKPSATELGILIITLFADEMPKKAVIENLVGRGMDRETALAHIHLLEIQLK